METTVQQIIDRIPAWRGIEDIGVEPMAGLTNTNYRLDVEGEVFVLRVSGGNTAMLGIDREKELECLQAASQAGIGPEVVHFLLPEGHLVTRCVEGRHLDVEEYRQPENLRRVVRTVKALHSLGEVSATFSPFRRVESFAEQARAFGVPFPQDFNRFLGRMQGIEERQRADTSPWTAFCHNDLYFVNFMDDGEIRLLDFEFAGMGDIYFDLATLVHAYEDPGPLPEALQEQILRDYFGQATPHHWQRLQDMGYMLLFFTAMWGLLQHGVRTSGILPVIEGFDCLAYANYIFRMMRAL